AVGGKRDLDVGGVDSAAGRSGDVPGHRLGRVAGPADGRVGRGDGEGRAGVDDDKVDVAGGQRGAARLVVAGDDAPAVRRPRDRRQFFTGRERVRKQVREAR